MILEQHCIDYKVVPGNSTIETPRSLLLGTPMGTSAWGTVAWCIAISIGGYAWARASYDRHSVRSR